MGPAVGSVYLYGLDGGFSLALLLMFSVGMFRHTVDGKSGETCISYCVSDG